MNEQNKNHYLIVACISFLMGYFSYNLIFAKDLNYGETKQITNTSIQIGSGESKIQKDGSGLQRISNPVQGDMKETGYIVHNATTKLSKETKTNGGDRLTKKITHKGFSSGDIKQQYVNYAYQIGGDNLKLLCECENGTWNIDTPGDKGNAFGFCQASINIPSRLKEHPRLDKEKFKTDWKYQLDSCWRLRQEGTPFYGPERKIYDRNGKYLGICYQYVKDRFYITNI